MELKEFSMYVSELQNFYNQELSEKEQEVWYSSLKFMTIERFNYILGEIYKTKKFMPRLSEILEIHNGIPYTGTKPIRTCKKCNGTGYVPYTKIIDGRKYQYFAVCDCGIQKRYDGRNCEDLRNRSEYYIPTLSELGMNYEEKQYTNEEIKSSIKNIEKSNMIDSELKDKIINKLKEKIGG